MLDVWRYLYQLADTVIGHFGAVFKHHCVQPDKSGFKGEGIACLKNLSFVQV